MAKRKKKRIRKSEVDKRDGKKCFLFAQCILINFFWILNRWYKEFYKLFSCTFRHRKRIDFLKRGILLHLLAGSYHIYELYLKILYGSWKIFSLSILIDFICTEIEFNSVILFLQKKIAAAYWKARSWTKKSSKISTLIFFWFFTLEL